MLSSFPPFSLVILTLFGNVQGATWNPLGCYPDPSTSRTLRAASYSDLANFTIGGCTDFCSSKGYNFAGMEYGHECFCDWRWHNLPLNPNSCDCFTAHCTGETNSYCGGSDCLQVFHRDPTFPPPTIAPLENGYQFEGCYTYAESRFFGPKYTHFVLILSPAIVPIFALWKNASLSLTE
jgi:hypothetical protein